MAGRILLDCSYNEVVYSEFTVAWASGIQFAFFAQVGWRPGNILIDVFSLIKPMKEHLGRTQMLNFSEMYF